MGIEIQILDWIQTLRTPLGDLIWPVVTSLGDGGFIWLATAFVLLLFPGTRRSGIILAMALGVDLILCNGVLKNLFARVRPCDVNTAVTLLVDRPADFSFPSGHTAASFASVSALYFAGEKRFWKAALVPACLIAFSRLYLYLHYPTDILGGIAVGILAGYLGFWTVRWMERRKAGICQ